MKTSTWMPAHQLHWQYPVMNLTGKPTMVTPVVVYCNRYATLGTDIEKFHRILHQKISLLERQVVCLVVVTSEFKIRDRRARHRTCRVSFWPLVPLTNSIESNHNATLLNSEAVVQNHLIAWTCTAYYNKRARNELTKVPSQMVCGSKVEWSSGKTKLGRNRVQLHFCPLLLAFRGVVVGCGTATLQLL